MEKQYRKHNKKTIRALVLLSGGIDSAVTALYASTLGYEIIPIFFRYGQITENKELFCVRKLSKLFNFRHPVIINLPWLKTVSLISGLINKNIQLRNQKEWGREYVPFRNTIFLSIAVAIAEAQGLDAIFIGSTATDRICPDNRPLYFKAFQKVMRLGTKIKTNIKVITPFANKSKSQVINIGHKLGLPFEFTWSCHKSSKKACGKCSNCISRIKAFRNNKLKDPIPYE
jgi:7-cyano-7-deazaguanine synthase